MAHIVMVPSAVRRRHARKILVEPRSDGNERVRVLLLEREHNILVFELPVVVLPDLLLVRQQVVDLDADERGQEDHNAEHDDGARAVVGSATTMSAITMQAIAMQAIAI